MIVAVNAISFPLYDWYFHRAPGEQGNGQGESRDGGLQHDAFSGAPKKFPKFFGSK
jgi:hypothetical protein